MKTIFFFFAMVASIATMATQPDPPVYYTGNDEPAASSVYSWQSAVDSLQSAVPAPSPSERARGEVECPVYFTGNDKPAAFGNLEFRILNRLAPFRIKN